MQQLSPKQKEFWNAPFHRWNIKHGATRSGKTYLDYFMIPRRIRERVGKEGLVVLMGNTKGTLQRNVIEPMQALYGVSLVSSIRSDNTATMFGERVHCLGADSKKHVDRLRGTSIKYCYGDEVVTWEKEVFEMLKSRLDKPYSCLDGTCNPGSPSHWFKAFIDSGADVFSQRYSLDDNPFLDATVRAEMEREHTGVFYDRYIRGLWTVADGVIYPEYKAAVVKTEERKYTKYYISCDYGIHNPTCFGLFGECGGAWYLVDEYYHSGRDTNAPKTDEEYYQELVRFAGNRSISAVIVDPSASSFITLIRRRGKFPVKQGDNAVLEGIRHTATALSTGTLKINDCCQRMISEFQAYSWDSKKNEDVPKKENDHMCDLLRYFVQTMKIAEPNRRMYY